MRLPSTPMKIPPPGMLLPGQPAVPVKKKVDSPGEPPAPSEPASSSNSRPGLPVTEGEFPIQPTEVPQGDPGPAIPDADSDTDSDATRDYGESQFSTLDYGIGDILLSVPDGTKVPEWATFDGDAFESWLTKQDKLKAGIITAEMARKYAKVIRQAKLEEFHSYLDNDAVRLTDRRKLAANVNYLTGRWVLTVKVDKNGKFQKFKARWVCRGFQDRHGWEQQTDSPTATRYGFRLVCQHAADHLWDLLHLDLKTAFLQGEHYNLSQRTVVVQLPNDIGLPPWMVGLCMRPVYGLNDAPRRWWNRLDKFLRAIGLEPTRADRCTYVCYQGTEGKNVKINASKLASHDSSFSSEEVESETVPQNSSFSSEKVESLLGSLLHGEEPPLTFDQTKVRSNPEVEQSLKASTAKGLIDYAWRPVVDKELLSFLEEKGLKDKGWFPFLGGHANVAHRAKALRSPEPSYRIKDFPFRISFVFRQGTWWVLERATDLRIENKPVFLEEEAAILVSLFLPEKKAYATDQTPQLTPELVDELLEHFVDPVHGSNSKGRLSVGCLSLHVDDLIITGSPKFLSWFLESIKKHFRVGHEDRNDLMFTGQRVKWIFDEKGNKKYISIDQSLNVSELEEIVIPKNLKDDVKCDKALHTSYRSLLGSINWLQSRTQFQACYRFSRLASASASPTIGNCKELNKLCRSIKQEPADMRIWPLKSKPRILGIPDAAFRNNSDKSSQRAMTIFTADDRVKGKRDTRGSLVFFESTKIKRTTLSTTVAELYALMKCFGTCQMLRGLWKDITGSTLRYTSGLMLTTLLAQPPRHTFRSNRRPFI